MGKLVPLYVKMVLREGKHKRDIYQMLDSLIYFSCMPHLNEYTSLVGS
jgi:hypothetical protein